MGGIAEPVDNCASTCNTASGVLPPCSGPTPHFNGGPGTIMSYCHQLGSYNNQVGG